MGNSQFKNDRDAFCKDDLECHDRNIANFAKFNEENPSNIKQSNTDMIIGLCLATCLPLFICSIFSFMLNLNITGALFLAAFFAMIGILVNAIKNRYRKEDLEYSIFLDSGNTLV
jgi:hypothetical protein